MVWEGVVYFGREGIVRFKVVWVGVFYVLVE